MRGRVYFWDERVLYVGPDVPSVRHAHHAVQVCISLSRPLRFRSSTAAPWRSHTAVVIPPDVPHETDPPVPLLATFWLDAETPEARGLFEPRVCPGIEPLPAVRVRSLVPRLRACCEEGYGSRQAAELLDEVIRLLAPGARPEPPLDPRVARARDLLRAAPARRVALAHLAAAVSLSPSRLAHLLRPALGLPVRRYLLWLRLRDALGEIARGATVTEAAHAAGFADAPHLDRTFRRMLGFTPSAARRVSQFVQAGASPAGYTGGTGDRAAWGQQRSPERRA
jgi:AraC family transcriptional regulator